MGENPGRSGKKESRTEGRHQQGEKPGDRGGRQPGTERYLPQTSGQREQLGFGRRGGRTRG